jgi:hypothetical protein
MKNTEKRLIEVIVEAYDAEIAFSLNQYENNHISLQMAKEIYSRIYEDGAETRIALLHFFATKNNGFCMGNINNKQWIKRQFGIIKNERPRVEIPSALMMLRISNELQRIAG